MRDSLSPALGVELTDASPPPRTEAQEYSHHNDSLQKYALTLHSEVLHLRSILNQLDGQSFPDVEGYLQREAQGGGIPTILRIAGPVLERDYQDVGRV